MKNDISPYVFPGVEYKKQSIKEKKLPITINEIEVIVCGFLRVDVNKLTERGSGNGITRFRPTMMCRRLTMHFAYRFTDESTTVISCRYGQDHTTLTAANKTINNYLEVDKDFRAQYKEIEDEIICFVKKIKDDEPKNDIK